MTGTMEYLVNLTFDTVYIALFDSDLAASICEELLRHGVDEEKILSGPLWKMTGQAAHCLDLD